jgi:hypothetical protein
VVEYIIEILKLDGAAAPQVLYTFAHTASSLHLVRESIHSVMKSPHWPTEANGFRIVSREGVKHYAWPISPVISRA